MDVDQAIRSVMESGAFIGGPVLDNFEKKFAEFLRVEECIGVGNGLDALRICLQALGIGPGDEVLVPAQTFIATWLAVTHVGAIPVPIDIDEETGALDVARIENAVTPRTVALVVVHLHGIPAPMPRIMEVAEKYDLHVVEDAAQAHGAEINGRRLGSWGAAAAFSFYPTKNLGGIGDAGAVVLRDSELSARARSLRSYGQRNKDKYAHTLAGWNSRLDPVQAAVLSVFLPRLVDWNARRRVAALIYLEAIHWCEEVQPMVGASMLEDSVWHHFVVKSERRDELRAFLKERGVMTEIHYPIPPVVSEVYAATESEVESRRLIFPKALKHSELSLSLPMSPWLGESVFHVVESVNAFIRTLRP